MDLVPVPLPRAARAPLRAVVDALLARHGADLIGVYRHGSLVTGEWVPGRSDVDLLVLRKTSLDEPGRTAEAALWLDLSLRLGPKGVEVHELVHRQTLADPLAYDFHFGESNRAKAGRVAAGATLCEPFVPGRDPELPGYLTVARRAPPLFGPPAEELWGVPAKELVIAGYLSDWDGVDLCRRPDAAYFILNACRTLAYVEDGLCISKAAGGRYALGRTPPALVPAITWALHAPSADWQLPRGVAGDGWALPPPCANDFLAWVSERTRKASALPGGTGAKEEDQSEQGDRE